MKHPKITQRHGEINDIMKDHPINIESRVCPTCPSLEFTEELEEKDNSQLVVETDQSE